MSRIIVKNLPKKVSEEEVKKYFAEVGPITDIKLKFKKGEFRRFCFIGYENEDDAKKAEKQYQNAYYKQSKILVELSKDMNTSESFRSSAKIKSEKSKPEVDKYEEQRNRTKEQKKSKNKNKTLEESHPELADDPNFNEYVKLNNKGEDGVEKCEDSHDAVVEADNTQEHGDEEEEDKVALKQDVSDTDYLQSLKKSDEKEIKTGYDKNKNWVDLQTVVIRICESVKRKDNKGKILTKRNVKDFIRPIKIKSLRIPRHDTSVAFVGFQSEKEMKQALLKDMSFIDGVRVKVQFHQPEPERVDDPSGEAPWAAAAERLKNDAEPVAESGKLFVRNLWYSATEESLREFFEKIGPITDITVPLCKVTRKAKGFAHITYVFPEHAVKCLNDLDGTSFKGRILHILPSLNKEKPAMDETSNFKDKKLKQQKATANSWHNWNSLFMSSAAVIDLMAEKYGRTKQDILDNEGDQSAAVNLALGEAQLVDECKRFLESSGISLDAFADPSIQRSSTVILAKNLCAKTTAKELEEIFGKYGQLGRVIMPPSGVTGLIEYLDPGEAKYGFKMLAYSKFKYLPLYLEWAPVKTFTTPSKVKKIEKEQVVTDTGGTEISDDVTNDNKTETEINPESNTTLYVKNLSFNTEEEALKSHFTQMGTVSSVLIAKRRNLSQGYGFVQYFSEKHAKKALRDLQDSYLDGHNIQVKFSEKVLTEPSANKRKLGDTGKQESAKLMVKNIPFHATADEIRQLFKTFGELKLVRLPLKPGQQEHRGFGFVEYVTKEDAKKAFESLSSSSHLYGRRLVLEWAKEEESVDELRRKTADQFLSANRRGPPTKKSRVDVDANIGSAKEKDH